MSCESKPDVISTPMHVRNRKMYMNRRFGFLYHGVLSPSTRRVTIGSAVFPVFTNWTMVAAVVISRTCAGVCFERFGVVVAPRYAPTERVQRVREAKGEDVRGRFKVQASRSGGDLLRVLYRAIIGLTLQ